MTTTADDTLVLRRTPLAGGVTLESVEQRSPHGTPVVFLHGVTDSWRSFGQVLPYLPRALRAIAVTQRGHGNSSRPESGYRDVDFAADLAAFLDDIAVERAVVVGHSMGALVAARFAIDHPERVLGLGLLGALPVLSGERDPQSLWDDVIDDLSDPLDPGFVGHFQTSTLARPIPAAVLDMLIGESLRVPARVWRAVYREFLDTDISHELGRITAPTLVLWGDRDVFCSRTRRDALVAALPQVQAIDYAGASHAVHWEEPERVARDIARFVHRLAQVA